MTYSIFDQIEYDGFLIREEDEVTTIPEAYGETGPPPKIRLVIQNGSRNHVVKSLSDLRRVVADLNLDWANLIADHGSRICLMLCRTLTRNRPIVDGALSDLFTDQLNVDLKTIEPRAEAGNLIWNEYQPLDQQSPVRCYRLRFPEFVIEPHA